MKNLRLPRFLALVIASALLAGQGLPGLAGVTWLGAGARSDAAGNPGGGVSLTVLNQTSVRLDWLEYDGSASGLTVQMKIDESGFERLADLPRAATSYEYRGILAHSVYVFRVVLRGGGSGSGSGSGGGSGSGSGGGAGETYCNEVIYRPSGAPIEPSAPALVQLSPSELRISWAYAEKAAFETEIQKRRDGDREYSFVATVPPGVNQYTDGPVEPNTLYRYRVRAKYGPDVYSVFKEASVRSAIDTPQITEIYAATPSSVYVAWTAVADAARYHIERRPRGESEYALVSATVNNRTYFTDSGVIPGERYFYRVKAISSNRSESLFSDEAEVAVAVVGMSQTITAIATGARRVELSWQDMGDNDSSYEIWRFDEQFSEWRLLDLVERDSTGYVDAQVGPGERYTYRIRARSADFDSFSKFSAETYTETIFCTAPSGLRQTNPGEAPVNLAWNDNSADEGRFVIERRNGHTGAWTRVATVGANVTERNGLSAPAASAWYFRVGAYSNEHRSVSYSDAILADNGYGMTLRGSSYRTDEYGAVATYDGDDGDGANRGGGNGGAGGNVGDARLDPGVVKELEKHNIVRSEHGVVRDGGDPVTRGEFVAMLVRALKADDRALGSFGDVTQAHPYYKEIMLAAKMGFVKAESANMFFPDRVITRAEMAVFVCDSLIANGTPLPQHSANVFRPFPDAGEVPAGIAAKVRSVFGEGIMIGIGVAGGGRVVGIDREATREQAALVIYRYMQWVGL